MKFGRADGFLFFLFFIYSVCRLCEQSRGPLRNGLKEMNSKQFCVEAGSALCRRGGLASRSCPHFEKSPFNVNRTSMGTPVCCCRAKMCSKIGSSLSVHKTKFYRTFSSNQGKRKFSSTILSLLSARHALIH